MAKDDNRNDNQRDHKGSVRNDPPKGGSTDNRKNPPPADKGGNKR